MSLNPSPSLSSFCNFDKTGPSLGKQKLSFEIFPIGSSDLIKSNAAFSNSIISSELS